GVYVLQLTADDGQVKTFDRVTVTSTLPVVTIAATDASAAELGLDAAQFTVTRTGGSGNNLTVSYTVAGTATNGTDYIALTGTITLPNGSATATIDITPLTDALAEGPESVIVTLTASANYALGAQAQATATIADLPVDAWRFAKFGANANDPSIAGDLANFDGDEFCTLLEYILGTDPLLPSANTLVVAWNGAECTLTYPRALAATDVTIVVEWSDDLIGWNFTGITDIEVSNNTTIATRRATVTPPGGKCWMRLRATR
ncbi:MAG: Calx-beta domain-containing protein, partial [Chthoniobacteraceae bacterium]